MSFITSEDHLPNNVTLFVLLSCSNAPAASPNTSPNIGCAASLNSSNNFCPSGSGSISAALLAKSSNLGSIPTTLLSLSNSIDNIAKPLPFLYPCTIGTPLTFPATVKWLCPEITPSIPSTAASKVAFPVITLVSRS